MKFISINFMKNYRIYFTRAMLLITYVARELAPAGPRSGPNGFSALIQKGLGLTLGLLRSPAGASSLATGLIE
ncbi:hypothetical protein [Pseudomonas sp. P7548]|uniref:hypothetical protein n=1 Tax=Pseudomonas sp. P7548 TaxID=2726981 RepID=UPI0015BFBD5C|nr:hypothetical protein [Pseudomonas sp. P7548]NWE22257.1 hypothetical protein [Pseudomonas sp. P7548]